MVPFPPLFLFLAHFLSPSLILFHCSSLPLPRALSDSLTLSPSLPLSLSFSLLLPLSLFPPIPPPLALSLIIKDELMDLCGN